MTISLKSLLLAVTFFNTPKRTSVFRALSWASSIIITLFGVKEGMKGAEGNREGKTKFQTGIGGIKDKFRG